MCSTLLSEGVDPPGDSDELRGMNILCMIRQTGFYNVGTDELFFVYFLLWAFVIIFL